MKKQDEGTLACVDWYIVGVVASQPVAYSDENRECFCFQNKRVGLEDLQFPSKYKK